MTLRVEPIVSSRQITYSVITNAIEKKIREAVSDRLIFAFVSILIIFFFISLGQWVFGRALLWGLRIVQHC
jgi:hypothetical protein